MATVGWVLATGAVADAPAAAGPLLEHVVFMPRTPLAGGVVLGGLSDLAQGRDAAGGIVPLAKQLVVDLGPLLPDIEAAVHGGPPVKGSKQPLKLEGLAIVDRTRVVIVNDDDFGVHSKPGRPGPRSCLFVIDLGVPLPGRRP